MDIKKTLPRALGAFILASSMLTLPVVAGLEQQEKGCVRDLSGNLQKQIASAIKHMGKQGCAPGYK